MATLPPRSWAARRLTSTRARETEPGDRLSEPGDPLPSVSGLRRLARSPAAWRLALLALGLALVFAVVALSGSLSTQRVRGWASGYGLAGPVVFVALSGALTVALVPGPLLAGASGLLFGTALGTPVSILAATLGATLAFSISRRVAGDAVGELGGPRLRALSQWLGRRGFRAVLYARIAPAVPYTAVNYAAGLTSIRLSAFVAATAIGVAPRAFAYTALGGHLDRLDSPEALIAVSVLAVMAIAGLALPWAQRRRARLGTAAPPARATPPSGVPEDRQAATPVPGHPEDRQAAAGQARGHVLR